MATSCTGKTIAFQVAEHLRLLFPSRKKKESAWKYIGCAHSDMISNQHVKGKQHEKKENEGPRLALIVNLYTSERRASRSPYNINSYKKKIGTRGRDLGWDIWCLNKHLYTLTERIRLYTVAQRVFNNLSVSGSPFVVVNAQQSCRPRSSFTRFLSYILDG